MALQGRHLFEKKVIFPAPHLSKTFAGIVFIIADKNNSDFFYNVIAKS
jgi:hypothetical protein